MIFLFTVLFYIFQVKGLLDTALRKSQMSIDNFSNLFQIYSFGFSMMFGMGVFLALLLETYTTMDSDAIYPALIFFMAGLGLYVGFTITKKMDQE
jgi:hypothetical protein